MYTQLILFRNELKNKHIHTYKLLGITTEIIFSKEIFLQNSNIKDFLKDVFNISFKEDVMKSRTTIVAKICRLICSSEDNNLYSKKLLKFIIYKIDELKEKENIKEKKNSLDGWV